MKIDLSGRTAIITGGSRGLGEAMAKALAESGAAVALVARDVKRLEAVRDFSVLLDVAATVRPDKEFRTQVERICGPECLERVAG